jgi:two-component sensor histidine kinase
MKTFFLFLCLFVTLNANTKIVHIDENTTYQEILPYSQIFIDGTKSLTFQEIQTKKFKENNQTILPYGYSPPFAVWVKFTLKNDTNKTIYRILQYDHEITADVKFFDKEKIDKEGIFNLSSGRSTLNPIFHIELNPYEERTYYLRAESIITPLIVKLNLWKSDTLYHKEINHQFILALFFGAMGVLFIYNLFIFFFTRDMSYLWYVLYIGGVTFHHLFYIGIVYKIPSNDFVQSVGTHFAYVMVTFPLLMLGLFSRNFLQTKQYPKIDMLLVIYLITIPIIVSLNIIFDVQSGWQTLYYISFMLLLTLIAFYGVYKKNRQAYFIALGWMLLYVSWLLMWLSGMGYFQIFEFYPYMIELGLLLEAILFSIALADRINTLRKKEQKSNQKLIEQQKNEEQRLKIEVENKTKDLSLALDEKEMLMRELHHRVKNNMQMVVSLLRLQSHDIDDERLKGVFKNAQNRISAMGHLHELLYKQDSFTHINSLEYFSLLINEIEFSAHKDVYIRYNIECDLKMEDAIYCGLILNEVVTNAYKYAFEDKGNIDINLLIQDDKYILSIKDDGKGFDKVATKDSLGFSLIKALVQKQLKGAMEILNDNGTQINIIWSKR